MSFVKNLTVYKNSNTLSNSRGAKTTENKQSTTINKSNFNDEHRDRFLKFCGFDPSFVNTDSIVVDIRSCD